MKTLFAVMIVFLLAGFVYAGDKFEKVDAKVVRLTKTEVVAQELNVEALRDNIRILQTRKVSSEENIRIIDAQISEIENQLKEAKKLGVE